MNYNAPPKVTPKKMPAKHLDNDGEIDWSSIDTQIEFDGTKIVLPGDPGQMDYDDAIETIARIRDSENQVYDVNELVAGAPWDALVALTRAMQSIYGVVIAQSIQTFFGEIKPDLITIHTGVRDSDRIQVAAGQMKLPNIEVPVFVKMFNEGARIFGSVKRKDRKILVDIANLARALMQRDSVYKGKAIRLKVDDDGDLGLDNQPEFIDLTRVSESDMIHTAETQLLIETNIFAPLKNTEACRKHRIPLKRGVLLEGKYGTGKSLTARVTARVANDYGWTFIMLDRAQGLKSAIEFARTYQPCVIFAEDIDRAADREDEDVNDLVNLLDGMISKDMEMMVVLTTNFIEEIDVALLRPGRFDAVIRIQPPDAETANRLIRAYARDLLPEDINLSEVGKNIDGQIPATIREVVERAKLGMLTASRSQLTLNDLLASAIGMRQHLELLNRDLEEETVEERFCGALREMMKSAFNGDFEDGDTSEQLENFVNFASQQFNKLHRGIDHAGMMAQASAGAATEASAKTSKLLEVFVPPVNIGVPVPPKKRA